jgi:hypothetical protein
MEDYESQPRALVVSKIDYMPSDEDISFVALKLNTGVSRAKLNETFFKSGFEPANIYSAHSSHDDLHYYMVEVEGYYEGQAKELDSLKKTLGSVLIYCDVIGGYPYIPELKRAKIG